MYLRLNSMANPVTHILFGTSPDAFYIGHGRRHHIQGMPEGFTKHAAALHIAMTLWISMTRDMQHWVLFNVATNQFFHNTDIPPVIRDHLGGADGKVPADFLTFSDDPDPAHFFLKGKRHASWSATLDDSLIQEILAQKRRVQGFDASVQGVLFGKGRTSLTMLPGGFIARLDGDALDPGHILNKTLTEFQTGWAIERGSTLCFYDHAYFFLKFKQQHGTTVQMRWNMPPHMMQILAELREVTMGVEEQNLLMQDDEVAMGRARTRMEQSMRGNR
ncbi:unnamed protein product [Mycena citricolor]|uniref:Uncharacterized protein n=1 Tax=Mycena citricolor TaxID=2018698 RepID=A0AAD2HL61_9AGAR|nr:unnamed protein product [Mycena citricolor]